MKDKKEKETPMCTVLGSLHSHSNVCIHMMFRLQAWLLYFVVARMILLMYHNKEKQIANPKECLCVYYCGLPVYLVVINVSISFKKGSKTSILQVPRNI